MKKTPFIEQTNDQDCGIACVTMLLAQKNKNITIDSIREQFKVGSNGLSMGNLCEILEFYGANVVCGKANKIEDFLTPSIVHMRKGHFVILEKVKKGIAYIVDPAKGRKKYIVSKMKDSFSEYFLSINNIDAPIKKRYQLPNFRPFVKIGVSLLIVTVLIQILLIQIPLLIKNLTDNINSFDIIKITPLLVILILIYLLANWSRGLLVISIENKLDYSIMNKFILKLVNMPASEFSLRSRGDLVFRATANEIIKQILSSKVIAVFIDLAFLVLYLYLLVNLSFQFGVLIVLLSVLVFLTLVLTMPKIMDLTDTDVSAKSDLQTFYTELVGRIIDIKTQNLENTYLEQWKRYFHNQISSFKKREILNNKLNTLIQAYQFSLPLVVFVLGISYVKNGNMSMGTLLAINSIGTMFMAPVISLSNSFAEIIYVKSYISKITDIINYRTQEQKVKFYEASDFREDLKIKNLSFSYGTFETEILKDINMVIPANKKIAIVGKSGSGKSTLLKILAGVYTDYEGEITLNNKDFSTYSYGHHLGVVLQESGLFNKTIKENISNILTDEKCLELLKEMNFSEELQALPYGLQTKINEEASNFSGGQIQKILLARSLANSPSLLLYDEATSALDNENQRIISERIRKKGITQVIVAHRLSTVLDADLIYVLDKGKIIEKGKPEELLSINSVFNEMINGGRINE
ncbi:peptidase domain-containing ABC transporter [Staphylococcus coagulans]|uniref:peptidase domain-containing ABC transporter n=1 Tax=Staphylococcus coagulans TaxID=74706 RepID=UPI0030ECA9EF